MDKYVKSGVTVAVFFAILSALVIPAFSDTQGELEDTIESVTSETEWTQVVNSSASSNYNITSGGVLDIEGSSGLVETDLVDSGDHERVEVYVEQAQGTTDVTIFDENDTSLGTTSVSGDGNATIDVDPYDVDSYYLEFDATGSSDSEVEMYETTGYSNVSNDVQVIVYIVLLLFLVAIALGIYKKHAE